MADLCCKDAVSVPKLTADAETGLVSSQAFFKAYEKHQAVLIKSARAQQNDKEDNLSWRGLAALFDSLTEDDQRTFCIENATANGDGESNGSKEGKPEEFLAPTDDEERRGYCSFLVQDKKTLADTLARLPMPQLPLKTSNESQNMRHGPCLWIFFGRNASKEMNLDGRPEHTDSVSHDGTWHYQLSGCKEWHIRPTAELIKRRSDEGRNGKVQKSEDPSATAGLAGSEEGRVIVKCNEGDVLILNTKLWWHKTIIPPQPTCKDDGKAVPSVSYARDVYFDKSDGSTSKKDDDDEKMSNLDGLYAADNIDKDTIIFTEEDMPDCELHRSEDPNCELVQLESGLGAIVSRRAIAAGEFFCIAESSDEEDDYEEEEVCEEEE